MTVKERVVGDEMVKIRVGCTGKVMPRFDKKLGRRLSLAVAFALRPWLDVQDNLLGESSFISRLIASFWVKRCVHLEAETTRDGGSLAVRDVIAARNERETLNEPRLPPSRRGVSQVAV